MNLNTVVFVVTVLAMLPAGAPGDDFRPDRCEVLPLPDHQVSFSIDGVEKLRWHFGDQYPRPFFYPFNGTIGSFTDSYGASRCTEP